MRRVLNEPIVDDDPEKDAQAEHMNHAEARIMMRGIAET
jgi:hypothetical protein